MQLALHTSMMDAIYGTQLASAATYTDALDVDTSLSVIFRQVDDLALAGADIGIRGSTITARVRVSELAQPKKGDTLAIGDNCYRVDGYDRLNDLEWILELLVVNCG
jgi:hypothetical protein